jgi:hypothetical protein
MMAELLYTTVVTYRTWENNPNTTLWPGTAGRIGRFYRSASDTLDLYQGQLEDLVPLHVASTQLAIPHEVLMMWYQHGEFEAVDMGILGLWVRRQDLMDDRMSRLGRS